MEGCGGELHLRVEENEKYFKTWSVPIQLAPVEGTCVTEVFTLNLE